MAREKDRETMLEGAKRNLIYAISSMDILAVSLIVPLYTQYLKSINFSHVNIGVLNSLYAGVQFFASPIVGHLSDVYGSRRMMIVTLLVCALCYPIMGSAVSFAAIASVRVLIGVVKHTQLLCKNYIEERANSTCCLNKKETKTKKKKIDKIDDEDVVDVDIAIGGGCVSGSISQKNDSNDVVGHSFGKLSAFMSLGYIVGPMLGGHFVDTPYGFAFMCCVTGALCVLNSALAYCLPVTRPVAQTNTAVGRRGGDANFVASFKKIPWSVCWDLFLLKLLTAFAVFSFYLNYNASVSSRYGISSVLLGYSLSMQGLVRALTGFATQPLYALFPATLDARRRICLVYLLLATNLAALYVAPSYRIYLACLVPFNACLSFLRIVNHEALVERIRRHDKGIILGAFNNVTAVSRFALPLVSGYWADRYGPDSAYLVSIATLLAAICVICSCQKRLPAVGLKRD